jgi:hypothetical protein
VWEIEMPVTEKLIPKVMRIYREAVWITETEYDKFPF